MQKAQRATAVVQLQNLHGINIQNGDPFLPVITCWYMVLGASSCIPMSQNPMLREFDTKPEVSVLHCPVPSIPRNLRQCCLLGYADATPKLRTTHLQTQAANTRNAEKAKSAAAPRAAAKHRGSKPLLAHKEALDKSGESCGFLGRQGGAKGGEDEAPSL